MTRAKIILTCALALSLASGAFAASERKAAPSGAPKDAPAEFTTFTARELTRGFLALAFGSDLRLGSKLKRIHRFDKPIAVHVIGGGSVDRLQSYRAILDEFARTFPNLRLSLTDDSYAADLVVRLIDEKQFGQAIRAAFGIQTAHDFVARTDAQCMTAVKSEAEGGIIHVDTFIIVDQGDRVFLNCAYHEMLHALGLPNHDQTNPWTTLNQNRMVGYLTVYDRNLIRMLYDPRIRSGMTQAQARPAAAKVARDLAISP
jgi:hypothetical protein